MSPLRTNLTLILSAVLCVATLVACGPRTYEDCVLKAMEGGEKGDTAAKLIHQVCRQKFPPGQDRARGSSASEVFDLEDEQLRQLTGKAGPRVGDLFGGSIYNGNEGVTVTEIEVVVTTTPPGSGMTTSRNYRDEVYIPPMSTGTLQFSIIKGDEGTDYGWSIKSAKGKVSQEG